MASKSTDQNQEMAIVGTGNFGNWLQRVRETGEFSDIIVEAEGQEFHLHLLPLLNASLFFRALPCDTGKEAETRGPRRMTLNSELVGGAKAFSVAADFCYLIKPNFTLQNVARIRAAAEYLGMLELLESTKKFLYTNVFNHWRVCIAFLLQYKKLGISAVDEYVESRCLRMIMATLVKAFLDTKYLSAPISLAGNALQSSPSQMLTEILVRTCSLKDEYVGCVVDELVNAGLNLNLKCRQGRNVKGWLDSTITAQCRNDRARCWIVISLARMLERSAKPHRPWLELSSQYWCSLLQHVGSCMQTLATLKGGQTEKDGTAWMQTTEWLASINCFLEQRIGGSLHELDEDLLSYKFPPQVLLSLVGHFRDAVQSSCMVDDDCCASQLQIYPVGQAYDLDHGQDFYDGAPGGELIVSERAVEEVALEVDECLWNLVQDGSSLLSAHDFIYIIQSFPVSARKSHDSLYAAIEKLIERYTDGKGKVFMDKKQINNLWSLVDVSKLSSQYHDKALKNAALLSLPKVMEYALHQHSQDLESLESDTSKLARISSSIDNDFIANVDVQNLKSITQKVVKASLKLLEENSRRSLEIMELRKQYTELLQPSNRFDITDASPTASVLSTSSHVSDTSSSQNQLALVHPPATAKEDSYKGNFGSFHHHHHHHHQLQHLHQHQHPHGHQYQYLAGYSHVGEIEELPSSAN